MRNSKLMKLLTVLLAFALLIGSATMIAVSAETEATEATTATVKVVSKNLNYASRTEILFAVRAENLAEGDKVIMLFWNSEQAEGGYTYEKAYYRKAHYATATVQGVEGCYLFASRGIEAADISSSIYLRPCIRHVEMVDDKAVITYTYGDVTEYNVAKYAAEKLGESANTVAQSRLYYNLIKYSNATATKFGGAAMSVAVFETSDALATFGELGVRYAAADKEGELFLRASTVNNDGEYFVKWVDENGATVSTNRVDNVDVSAYAPGFHTLTAVYGTADESLYSGAFDFQSLSEGKIPFSADLSKAPSGNAYGNYTGTAMKLYSVSTTINSALTIHGIVLPTYDAENNNAPVVGEDGMYSVYKQDEFYVKSHAGDKYLHYVRNQSAGSNTVFSFANTVKTVLSAEADVTFTDSKSVGDGYSLNIVMKGTDTAKTGAVTLRMNFATLDSGEFGLYAEVATGYDKVYIYADAEKQVKKSIGAKSGETFTYGVEIIPNADYTDGEVKITVNGEYFGSFALTDFTASNGFVANLANFDFANAYITYLNLPAASNGGGEVSIDNVGFFK